MKLLITGGTVFVSRFTAEWFVSRGHEVYVLNRGTRPQVKGVHLIRTDRRCLADELRSLHFDAVIDVCAYNAADVNSLLDALGSFDDYVLISSSAVYPEMLPQPFREDQPVGPNSIWGSYGMDKIAAEKALFARCRDAYVIRPPYLYGPMQNIYREPFVFDCAMQDRPFLVPGDGSMPLQFFHVEDLCRVVMALLSSHPDTHILNVGNAETVSVCEFVRLCYAAAGKKPRFIYVDKSYPQRSYFCFHDYAYRLDVTLQQSLIPSLTPLDEGLAASLAWYTAHPQVVMRRDYLTAADAILAETDSIQ